MGGRPQDLAHRSGGSHVTFAHLAHTYRKHERNFCSTFGRCPTEAGDVNRQSREQTEQRTAEQRHPRTRLILHDEALTHNRHANQMLRAAVTAIAVVRTGQLVLKKHRLKLHNRRHAHFTCGREEHVQGRRLDRAPAGAAK